MICLRVMLYGFGFLSMMLQKHLTQKKKKIIHTFPGIYSILYKPKAGNRLGKPSVAGGFQLTGLWGWEALGAAVFQTPSREHLPHKCLSARVLCNAGTAPTVFITVLTDPCCFAPSSTERLVAVGVGRGWLCLRARVSCTCLLFHVW